MVKGTIQLITNHLDQSLTSVRLDHAVPNCHLLATAFVVHHKCSHKVHTIIIVLHPKHVVQCCWWGCSCERRSTLPHPACDLFANVYYIQNSVQIISPTHPLTWNIELYTLPNTQYATHFELPINSKMFH